MQDENEDSFDTPAEVGNEQPFQVYLDNPSEFYSLRSVIQKTPIVSTDCSDLDSDSVFNGEVAMSNSSGGGGLPAAAAAAPVQLQEGVREALKAKQLKLKGFLKVYNPDKNNSNVLSSNKAEWFKKVNACHEDIMDFAVVASTAAGVTDDQEAEIERITD